MGPTVAGSIIISSRISPRSSCRSTGPDCSETGEQIDRVKQITLRLTQPDRGIGPITLDVPYKSPAHYELLGPALGVPGTWDVDVDLRVSKFEVLTAETEIEVASR